MDITIKSDLMAGDVSVLEPAAEKLAEEDVPVFVKENPDLGKIIEQASQFRDFRNIIVVGYGGSFTNFNTYYTALYHGDKNVCRLNTVDPDLLNDVRNRYSPEDTLVILISKSGTTSGIIQSYLFFKEYKMVFITEDNDNTLSRIAKENGITRIIHPPVGGRYSGRTTCALFPAAVIGLPIEEIDKGFQESYAKCGPHFGIVDNPALRLAAECFLLEKKGYEEIFMPIYSPYLEGISELIIQLIHESSGKRGQGQTIFTGMAPESQHHTNQRFFGGKKNVLGLFVTVKKHNTDSVLSVPDNLAGIGYKDRTLEIFEGLPLSKALEFEFQGTYQNSLDKHIPCANIELPEMSPRIIGQLIGFFQYFAVYSSVLRDVNPFDQPAVEDSKRISIDLIKRFSEER